MAKSFLLLALSQAFLIVSAEGRAPRTHAPAPASETESNYYVSSSGNDSNPGTKRAPWRTIQKAADTVDAGDTVVLLDGSYEEPSINFRRSGVSGKPITFKAQNKWKAILSSTSGCNPGFSINASYITVKDIRFSVSPRNVTCPTYTSSNVAIRAWAANDPTPANPSTGTVGFVADGVYVDAGPERSEGVKSNQDFTIIQNSESGNALEIFNSKDSIIRNNIVFGQDKYGISIFAKGGVRNAQIYNNVVRNKFKGGYGIYLGGYSCDACFFDKSTKIEAYNSVAYNNVVINESGGSMNGLIFSGAKDSAFYNNVVIDGQLGVLRGGHNRGFRALTVNPTFKNNIVVCNGKSVASDKNWGEDNFTGALLIDHNNFHDCSDAPEQKHPVIGKPLFIDPASDWRLRPGSPAINSGTPVTMTGYDGTSIDVSRDKKNIARVGKWDLGVYKH